MPSNSWIPHNLPKILNNPLLLLKWMKSKVFHFSFYPYYFKWNAFTAKVLRDSMQFTLRHRYLVLFIRKANQFWPNSFEVTSRLYLHVNISWIPGILSSYNIYNLLKGIWLKGWILNFLHKAIFLLWYYIGVIYTDK